MKHRLIILQSLIPMLTLADVVNGYLAAFGGRKNWDDMREDLLKIFSLRGPYFEVRLLSEEQICAHYMSPDGRSPRLEVLWVTKAWVAAEPMLMSVAAKLRDREGG